MERAARLGSLYDFYGTLLTDRQCQWVELHYFEDLSLAEIAEQFGVTRQAVHDNLRRAEEQLEAYEAALQLIRAHQRRIQAIAALRGACEALVGQVSAAQSDGILHLLDDLATEG